MNYKNLGLNGGGQMIYLRGIEGGGFCIVLVDNTIIGGTGAGG